MTGKEDIIIKYLPKLEGAFLYDKDIVIDTIIEMVEEIQNNN